MSGERSTLVPSARRLMTSLRDIGYDLPAAVADLVDNSIDAGAQCIDVELHEAGAGSWLRVSDDGLGMRPAEIDEAMRYGSERGYDDRALGHFGLGLKTASLSQCRRLTVASRRGARGRLSVRAWDLDEIARSDAWLLERPDHADWPEHLIAPLAGRGGTVVLWDRLDRLLAMRRPDGAAAARTLRTMAGDIAVHLAMVFHRFLSAEATAGRRALTIRVNGTPLLPWDPFARSEAHTRSLQPQRLPLSVDGRSAEVEVAPFILPAQHLFSSPEAHAAAAGPNRWNRQQGLYVYRRDRLIQSGGWNRLRTLDEHSKLARVAVELPPADEGAFQISVAKMGVAFPAELRPALRAVVSGVVAEAQRRYRAHVPDPTPERLARPTERAARGADTGGVAISRDWPVISAIVQEELADQPRVRDRLLLRLANAPAPGGVLPRAAELGRTASA